MKCNKEAHYRADSLATERNNGLSDTFAGTGEFIIGHGYSPEQLERAKNTVHRAWQWRVINPDAWSCVVSHASDLASMQQPIAAQSLIESVRKKSFVDRFGNDTKTDNSFASVFIRWLWAEHPEARPYIELRRCAVGVVMNDEL